MELLVVADDLTGAGDTGGVLARRGFETTLSRAGDESTATEWPATVEVAVVDTDSRYVPAATAKQRVRRAITDASAERVYLKIDSTLRGNLTAAVDTAMESTGATLGLVAPAFPTMGRRTAGGYHLVDETPVADTEAGADPNAPVTTSYLPELLADSEAPLTRATLDDLRQDRLADTFAAAPDGALVVCDATSDTHLDQIAHAAAGVSGQTLYVGSAGLSRHVRLGPERSVLGVVGSVAPETLTQLEQVPDGAIVLFDPAPLVSDRDAELDRVVDRAVDRLTRADSVIVTAATDRTDVNRTLAAGDAAGLTDQETKDHVAAALAAVVPQVREETGLDGLFVTGGAVANATLEAVAADRVRLFGTNVEMGVPLGFAEGGDADGLPIVTKAGGFGAATTIVNCLRFLSRYHEADRCPHDG